MESDKNFPSQIRIISLSDASPYETLHSYVSNTLAPFFKSYIKSSSTSLSQHSDQLRSSGESSSGVSAISDQLTMMEKRIDEVELGFLHLQQNIDIPEINFDIHAHVARVLRKCQEENRKHKFDDCAEFIEDTNFLNQIQNSVNRWTRDIREV